MSQKEFIVFMGSKPEAQIKCYNLIKLAYGENFETYSDLRGVIVSEAEPHLFVNRNTKRISRCSFGRISETVDDLIKTIPNFAKELNPIINSLPTRFNIGDYRAEASKDVLVVGCQTIPFEQVKQAYDTMVNLRS